LSAYGSIAVSPLLCYNSVVILRYYGAHNDPTIALQQSLAQILGKDFM